VHECSGKKDCQYKVEWRINSLIFKRQTFEMVVAWAGQSLFKCPLLLCI
jgi:hypothetical protein